MFDTVMFDLDGTIADSFEGIANSILYALEKLGVPAPPRESLVTFVGPPLFDEFRRRFGMDDETAREAVRLYREFYPKTGIFQQTPIDGAEELLKTLRSRSIKIVLATSKPQEYAETIIRFFGFGKYFDCIVGASMDGSVSKKADVIALALEKASARPESTLMVGDRLYDVEGAHACKVRCAGVLCGFGSEEELKACGADHIVGNLIEIAHIPELKR